MSISAPHVLDRLARLPAALGFAVILGAPASAVADDSPDPLDLDDEEIIVVTDSRRERPLSEATVATEVITRESIEDSGAENLAELLEDHPGVDVFRSFRGSAIRMQGLDPDYVLVLVDGERTLGRIGGALDLERFATSNIERVEIVKGASSALYGSDALAGVVNIITRDAERPIEAELHSSVGSQATLDLTGRVGVRRGDWKSHLSAGWHRSDGYDLDTSNIATTASSYDETVVGGGTSYRFSRDLELTARGEYLLRDQNGVDLSASGAILDRDTRTETASAALKARWRPRRGDLVTVSAHYGLWKDQFLSDQRGADDLDRYEVSREDLGELKAQYDTAITARHFTTVGVEGLVEALEADRLSEQGSRSRLSLFGQHEWTASTAPNVVAVPGVRVDLDSQFGSHVSPKLAARWDVTDGLIARAAYGWGFRAPGFRELLLRFENPGVGYRVEGNPDLEPETSRSANAGAEARLHRRAWLAVNLFHNDIDNLIATDLVDDGGTDGTQVFGYVNIASARTMGVESLVKGSPIRHLLLEAGYTFTDTLDRDTGDVLPGRARHRVTFKATYKVPAVRGSAHVRGSIYGKRRFFAADGAMDADAYASVDGRVQAGISRRLVFFAGATNLLDEGDPLLNPIPPRSFYGGLTARY